MMGMDLSCGWGTGGKAIPAGGMAFAPLIARDQPHRLAENFTLKRFAPANSSTRQPHRASRISVTVCFA